ncbi:MAG TPA: hypothetical protein VF191_16560 [Cyclobacteriaceae bacterium]
MKRFASIVFLFLFLFNVGGYYFVFVGLQYQASLKFSEKVDNQEIEPEDTYLFKVALTLPYHITDNGYEKVTGLVEHRGTYYRLLKQRYANDTLYIVCVRDQAQERLAKQLTRYAKLSNDIPVSHEGAAPMGKAQSVWSKMSKDFNSNQLLEILSPDFGYLRPWYAITAESLLSRAAAVPTPPPKDVVG